LSYPLHPLSSLGVIQTGSTPLTSKNEYWGGDIPFVTPGDLDQILPVETTPRTLSDEGAQQSRMLQKGSVMVCCIGSLGKIGIAGRTVVTNQQINSVEFDPKKIWPKFGFYACKRLKPQLLTMAPATTIAIVSKSKFGQLEIPVPPLPEQRRIAAILDQADALRTKRREALAQLDSLTQSIFIEMFGDPATNSKRWAVGQIRDLLESASYGTSEKSTSVGEFPVLRMNNLTRTGELDLSDLKYMDLPLASRERYLAKPGDVLFNRTNSAELVGKSAMVPEGVSQLAYAGYLVRLRVNHENEPVYLARFLNMPYAKRMLRSMCKSIIGMANINAKEIQAMTIALPPLPLQQIFATRIKAVEALKATHRGTLAELDALFASLQYRAFRGEL
jgi:type I restriction enzyme S subunit